MRPGGWQAAVAELDTILDRAGRVIAQTRTRLSGITPASATRLVSLHDPDARPIAKGRLGKPVEFGYKAQFTDNTDGIVLDYSAHEGNPADAPLLAPGIGRIKSLFGTPPGAVTADRGYGEAKVDETLTGLGVNTVVIPRKGKPSAARREVEHGRGFRRLVKWRTGSEGRISYLKRRYGLDRTLFDGLTGARTWCGLGVLSHNSVKIAALVQARHHARPARAADPAPPAPAPRHPQPRRITPIPALPGRPGTPGRPPAPGSDPDRSREASRAGNRPTLDRPSVSPCRLLGFFGAETLGGLGRHLTLDTGAASRPSRAAAEAKPPRQGRTGTGRHPGRRAPPPRLARRAPRGGFPRTRVSSAPRQRLGRTATPAGPARSCRVRPRRPGTVATGARRPVRAARRGRHTAAAGPAARC